MFFHITNFRYLASVLVVLFAVFTTSCMNSIDQMLEDYNESFMKVQPDPKALEPGDLGYNPDNLLLPEYFVALNASLNIPSSDRGASFSWSLTKLNKSSGLKTVVYKTMVKNFVLQVSDYPEIQEGTYCLTLVLTVESGETFMDEAYVFVYDHKQIDRLSGTNVE